MRSTPGMDVTAAGVVVLILNLTSRHIPAIHNGLFIDVSSWVGAILIVVGLGAMMFLEQRR